MPQERLPDPGADARKLVSLQVQTRLAFSRKLAGQRSGNRAAVTRANEDLERLGRAQDALVLRELRQQAGQ